MQHLVKRVLVFSLFAASLRADFSPLSDEELIKKYAPPKEVVALLSDHTDFLLQRSDECSQPKAKKKFRTMAWRFKWLPGYYLKGRISRIKGIEKALYCIEKFNLDRLAVPKKYLYHIPGRDKELTDRNYLVIAERVYSVSKQVTLDAQEARQITTLIKQTGLIDLVTTNNVLRNREGKLILVDTEDKKGNTCYGIHKIISKGKWDVNTSFTKDALKHFLNESMACAQDRRKMYRKVYNRILNKLSKKKRPDSWDYVEYFTSTFCKPR